jgi:hypothetical protein
MTNNEPVYPAALIDELCANDIDSAKRNSIATRLSLMAGLLPASASERRFAEHSPRRSCGSFLRRRECSLVGWRPRIPSTAVVWKPKHP